MRIKSLALYLLEVRLRAPFETSFGLTDVRRTILVQVEDKTGEIGWGEVVSGNGPWYSYETIGTSWHVIRDYIAPEVVGKEMEQPRDFWSLRKIRGIRGHNMAKAGVEEALWDLYSRMLSKPLYKVIGGIRNKILSGISIGIKKSVYELINEISKRLEEGYKRIKLKIKPGWDVDVIDKVRKAYPDILLQVDANAAYTLEDAARLKMLDKYNLLMIEQPLSFEDLVGHSRLAKELATPICLDESIKSPYLAWEALEIGACSIINIKPGRVGGIIPSIQIHDLCMKNSKGTWIGGMLETGVGRGHLVALATLPNIRYYNDISASNRYYEEDIVEPPWILNPDSTINVPEKPGIGVEVVEERVRSRTLKKLVIK